MSSDAHEESSKALGIHRKIQNVIAEMNGVEQKGYNNFQKYNYTRQEDVVSGVRPLLVKHGLIVLSDIIEESTQYIQEKDSFFTKVKVEYNIIDTDTGDMVTKTYYGHGIDKGDKAIYKAITGSEKYFYMKNFLIGTPNDDPEYDGAFTNPNYIQPSRNTGGRQQKTAAERQTEIVNKVNSKATENNAKKEHQAEDPKKKTSLPESTINKELQKALFDSARGNEEIVRNAISKFKYSSTSQIKLSEYKIILNDIVKQTKALA